MQEQTANILIVEDDPDINNLLATLLKNEGYDITQAYSGSEAGLRLKNEQYDLLLLDLMLPGISGEALIEQVRKEHVMPIIVISAKGRQDKLNVLRIGADDFIEKPFDVEEVSVRVSVQLRRYGGTGANHKEETLSYLNLQMDVHSHSVTLLGQPISLTAHEFGILQLLLTHPRKVFTRANLFETVWADSYYGDDNTINVHISNLRNKLAQVDPDNTYVKTVWGVGFKLGED